MEPGCIPASGTHLLTPYGWGVVSREESTEARLVVSLSHDEGGATVYLNPADVQRCAVAAEGACLETKYGMGVLLRYEKDTDFYVVRLWRPRGMGSAEAHLRADTILRELPACPGFEVSTPYGKGRALHFDTSRDMYTVELPFGTAFMHASSVSCPRAKLLPAIAYLAARSRRYWRSQWGRLAQLDGSSATQGLGERLQTLGSTKTVAAVAEESQRLGSRLNKLLAENDDIAEVGAASERIIGELWNPESKSGQKTAQLLEGARGRLLRRLGQLSATPGTASPSPESADGSTAEEKAQELADELNDGLNSMMVKVLEKWTDGSVESGDSSAGGVDGGGSGGGGGGDNADSAPKAATLESKVAQLTEVLQLVSDSAPQGEAFSHAKESAQNTSRRWGAQTSERLEAAMLQMISQEEARNGYTLTGVDLLDRFKSGKSVYRSVVSPWVLKAKAALKQVGGEEQSELWDELSAPLEDVLARIADGSFTWDDAVSSTAASLDADNLADVARGWMVEGENVMSTLEQWGASPSLKHTIRTLKDMDIEKRLMSGIEDLDTEYVLESAESAMVDADARARLINDTKDTVLEFLLEHLPAINVPDIDGVKDDVEYHIGNLDMSGFRMRKEDVVVVLGSSLQDEVLSVSATNIGAQFKQLSWGYKQLYFPYMYGEGTATATVQNARVKIGFRMTRLPPALSDDVPAASTGSEHTKDVASDAPGWRPALTVSSIDISMEDLTLAIDDTSLAWLYNLLASVFAYAIKDYVCDTLKATVEEHLGTLIGAVNAYAREYWPYLLSMLSVSVAELPVASHDERVMLKQADELWEAHYQQLAAAMQNRDVALVFTKPGSLGLQLEAWAKKYRICIRGVTSESAAEELLQQRGLLRYIKGAQIAAVESVRLLPVLAETGDAREEPDSGDPEAYAQALQLIKSGERPLHLTLRLSAEALATMAEEQTRMADRKAVADLQRQSTHQADAVARRRALQFVEHSFGEGQLGMKLRENKSCGGAMIVAGFVRGASDEMLQAEASGKIRTGMIVARIGSDIVFGRPFDESLRLLQAAERPVTLSFARSPDCSVTLDAFPEDLSLGPIRGHIMVTGFRAASGPARDSEQIYPGMVILQTGNAPIPSNCTPEECLELIRANCTFDEDTNSAQYRLFFRDMDAFVKLIQLREQARGTASAISAAEAARAARSRGGGAAEQKGGSG